MESLDFCVPEHLVFKTQPQLTICFCEAFCEAPDIYSHLDSSVSSEKLYYSTFCYVTNYFHFCFCTKIDYLQDLDLVIHLYE